MTSKTILTKHEKSVLNYSTTKATKLCKLLMIKLYADLYDVDTDGQL